MTSLMSMHLATTNSQFEESINVFSETEETIALVTKRKSESPRGAVSICSYVTVLGMDHSE